MAAHRAAMPHLLLVAVAALALPCELAANAPHDALADAPSTTTSQGVGSHCSSSLRAVGGFSSTGLTSLTAGGRCGALLRGALASRTAMFRTATFIQACLYVCTVCR